LVRLGLVERPIHGELHVIGIERRTVMTEDALFKFERVVEPVVADDPTFRDVGLRLAVHVEGEQRLIDLVPDLHGKR